MAINDFLGLLGSAFIIVGIGGLAAFINGRAIIASIMYIIIGSLILSIFYNGLGEVIWKRE